MPLDQLLLCTHVRHKCITCCALARNMDRKCAANVVKGQRAHRQLREVSYHSAVELKRASSLCVTCRAGASEGRRCGGGRRARAEAVGDGDPAAGHLQ